MGGLNERFIRNEELIRAITLFAAAHANGLPAFVNMHLPAEGVLPRSVGYGDSILRLMFEKLCQAVVLRFACCS